MWLFKYIRLVMTAVTLNRFTKYWYKMQSDMDFFVFFVGTNSKYFT